MTIFIARITRISHIGHTPAGETAPARLSGLDRFPASDDLDSVSGKVTRSSLAAPETLRFLLTAHEDAL